MDPVEIFVTGPVSGFCSCFGKVITDLTKLAGSYHMMDGRDEIQPRRIHTGIIPYPRRVGAYLRIS